MATYIWGVLCSDVVLDAHTGEASYIKTVVRLQPDKLPARLPNIFAAVTWKRAPGEDTTLIRMRAIGPDEEEFAQTEAGKLEFNDTTWWRNRFPLVDLVIEQPGTHNFVLEQQVDGKWVTEAKLPLDISPPSESKEERLEAEVEQ
jgi:hypothetical protein